MVKYGLKLWSTNCDLIKKANVIIKDGFFDYVELMVVPKTEIAPFQEIDVPYIIHITSERWGLNIADKKKENNNLETINQCINWADTLGAEYLILHSGFGEINNAKEFLQKISDERILIENMPRVGMSNEDMIGYSPKQIKDIIGDRFSFCLDLNHAIKASISLGRDYKEFVKEFLKLNPKVIHISDGNLDTEKDEHLSIGAGDYDFKFLADCIGKSGVEYMTIETPKINLNSLKTDLENLKKIKEYLQF